MKRIHAAQAPGASLGMPTMLDTVCWRIWYCTYDVGTKYLGVRLGYF